MLDAIGLDDDHVLLYRSLLAAPSAAPDELARVTGLDSVRVRRLVDELEGAGLVARQASAPDRVVASPPSLALRPLLLESERRLAAAHEALVHFSELYRHGAEQRAAPDVVDVVVGPDAVRQRLAQLQASALERVDVFVLSEVALMASQDNLEEERALRRGVRYRVIIESEVAQRPGFIDSARVTIAAGEDIRVLPSLPTRLFLVDDAIALLPMYSHGPDRVSGALLVHPSGLLDLVMAMFGEYWSAARPLLGPDEPSVSQADRDLLSLLVLGMTDAAAASQLSISVRTVQRRVAELAERAGVLSRFQLGAEAVRRGWV
ncbi:transcriptional regulator TrmB [Microbacterium protaetiae]|uniref:Transcriptional regulator TrmB n=1 Tax=Microbacterium protaetiae TaxID=2509458 RepID=A0A4P6EF42_9MICO|nr:helix-turn-helix domain-containing protein [Microbacterium protaetiae]QAY58707.1 transcriptional regulator TrmB [Microbacterium protaetiae]